LQVDNAGNVYTLVPGRCVILKLDKASQKVHTLYGTPDVCGNGTNQLGLDPPYPSRPVTRASAICMNNAKTTLYVVDAYNGEDTVPAMLPVPVTCVGHGSCAA
jgi:hypothetical protein